MGKYRDLTGKRFERLMVLGVAFRKKWDNGYTRYFWRCQCDCGKEVVTQSTALLIGKMLSCGCYSKELQKKRHQLGKGVAAANAILYIYKTNSQKSGLPFELSREDFLSITSQNCHYCGSPPSNCYTQRHKDGTQKLNGKFIYNGIDRKDNNKGYLMENCLPCCDICNKAKRGMPYHEFKKWIKKLSEFTLAAGS